MLTKVTVADEMPMNCAKRGNSGMKTGYSNSFPHGLVLAFILLII